MKTFEEFKKLNENKEQKYTHNDNTKPDTFSHNKRLNDKTLKR